jgi:hypothetical protein
VFWVVAQSNLASIITQTAVIQIDMTANVSNLKKISNIPKKENEEEMVMVMTFFKTDFLPFFTTLSVPFTI